MTNKVSGKDLVIIRIAANAWDPLKSPGQFEN